MKIKPIRVTLNGKSCMVFSEWVCAYELTQLAGLVIPQKDLADNLKLYEFDISRQPSMTLKLSNSTKGVNDLVVFSSPYYRMKP